ncbi:winged helix-turn-helix domain-containing protein [Streptomyces capitiformicae]|uniref:HTH arsR-type domain-containing protein n=2 Tax=Streptomyces capitiformicae TaxID=2014920 RepID=A0A918ZN48_9ACTN|nr:hypothetical protein GCM10017771_81670 [Streptomyces capitiformicae]
MTGDTLQLGSLEQVRVGVSRHPGATLFSVLKDVWGGCPQGVPRPWRQLIQQKATPATAVPALPLFRSRDCWVPDCLALTRDVHAVDMDALLDELHDLDPDRLTAEVTSRFPDTGMPPLWRSVLNDSQGFVAAYQKLVTAAWEVFAPVWAQADRLFGREMERIGIAAVTGGLAPVLAGLDSVVHYQDGALRLPHPASEPHTRLGDRTLVLVPLASGFAAGMYGIEGDDHIWIGYPLPGLAGIVTRVQAAQPPPGDALNLVLGPVRAAILRHLSQPPSVSELAHALQLGVSTVTYHCDQLAAAGLLDRQRYGRQVRLHRTPRGSALLELLTNPLPN